MESDIFAWYVAVTNIDTAMKSVALFHHIKCFGHTIDLTSQCALEIKNSEQISISSKENCFSFLL